MLEARPAPNPGVHVSKLSKNPFVHYLKLIAFVALMVIGGALFLAGIYGVLLEYSDWSSVSDPWSYLVNVRWPARLAAACALLGWIPVLVGYHLIRNENRYYRR